MNKLASSLGLAKKAGLLAVGTELTRTAVRCGKARLVLTASDASDNAIKRAVNLCEHYHCPLKKCELTAADLGGAAGKAPAAMAAVCDKGFAEMIFKLMP